MHSESANINGKLFPNYTQVNNEDTVNRSLSFLFFSKPEENIEEKKASPNLHTIAKAVFDEIQKQENKESLKKRITSLKPDTYNSKATNNGEENELKKAAQEFDVVTNLDLLFHDIINLSPASQRKILVDILYRESDKNILDILRSLGSVFSEEFISELEKYSNDWYEFRKIIENQILIFNQKSQAKIITKLLEIYFTNFKKRNPDTQLSSEQKTIMASVVEHYLYYTLEDIYKKHTLQKNIEAEFQKLKSLDTNPLFINPDSEQNKEVLEKIRQGEVDLNFAIEIGPEETWAKLHKKAKWYEKLWQWFITIFFGGGRTIATIGLSFLFFFTFVALFHLSWSTPLIVTLGIISALATGIAFLLSRVVAIYENYAPSPVKKPKLYEQTQSNKKAWKMVSIISALGAGATAYVGIAVGITKLLAYFAVSVSPTSVYIVPFAILFAFSSGLSHLSFLAKDLDDKWEKLKNFFQGSFLRKFSIVLATILIAVASGLVLIYTAMSGTRKLLGLAEKDSNKKQISLAAELLGAILTLANLITNTLSQVAKCISFLSGANIQQTEETRAAPEDFNVEYSQKSGLQRLREIWVKYCSLSWQKQLIFAFVMLFDVTVYGGLATFVSACLMCELIGIGGVTASATIGISVVFAIIGLLVYGVYTWNAVYEKFGSLHQYNSSEKISEKALSSQEKPQDNSPALTQKMAEQSEKVSPVKQLVVNAEIPPTTMNQNFFSMPQLHKPETPATTGEQNLVIASAKV